MILLDIGFRFAAMALLGLLALLMLRRGREHLSGLLALAFVAGLVSYLILSGPMQATLPGWLEAGLLAAALANPLLFWALTRSMFDERFRLKPLHGAFLAVVEILGFLSVLAHTIERGTVPGSVVAAYAGPLLRVASVAFIVAAIVVAHRRAVPPLSIARRKVRVMFVSIVGAYMLLIVLSELLLGGSKPHPVVSLLNAAAVLAIVAGVCVGLLTPRLGLLLEPARANAGGGELAAEQELVERLDKAMAERAYRREGLTIGQLAEQLQMQEHRLRALINSRLGFRNFAEFLNRHRVAEACERLADPAQSKTSILTICLELGYGSIGPFNRAFKQATGTTPTQYRRERLEGNPERGGAVN